MAWYKVAKQAGWENFAQLKQTFGSADWVGNCVVFDVGNNRYRLIGRVNFRKYIIYVLKVMDHKEYDKGSWAEECGCHQPPPKMTPPLVPKKNGPAHRPRNKRKRKR
jgi:mRNA interferase HigB